LEELGPACLVAGGVAADAVGGKLRRSSTRTRSKTKTRLTKDFGAVMAAAVAMQGSQSKWRKNYLKP
jgi:hypothetical protein